MQPHNARLPSLRGAPPKCQSARAVKCRPVMTKARTCWVRKQAKSVSDNILSAFPQFQDAARPTLEAWLRLRHLATTPCSIPRVRSLYPSVPSSSHAHSPFGNHRRPIVVHPSTAWGKAQHPQVSSDRQRHSAFHHLTQSTGPPCLSKSSASLQPKVARLHSTATRSLYPSVPSSSHAHNRLGNPRPPIMVPPSLRPMRHLDRQAVQVSGTSKRGIGAPAYKLCGVAVSSCQQRAGRRTVEANAQ